MIFSYNWIKELLPALEKSSEEIAKLLTEHSFETIVTRQINIDPAITVAKITGIKPHPKADRIRLVTVTDGSQEIQVVCGAQNINVGDIVPYSPPGAKLYDENSKPFTVTEATIRGESSPGMLNSPRELGLGEEHSGIYILPPDTPPGSQLADHLPPDTILEADIEPNRAHDCLSHLGIAREIAAILNLEVKEPSRASLKKLPELSDWTIKNDAPGDVARYFGAALTDINIAPAPLWLQARLWAAGTHPINNIVDITNYVMFELGNPTHAFAADKLPGQTIGLRFASANETMTTLDGAPCSLSANNLLITSNDQPVAVAGVMGGQQSEVGANTRSIFLEVASFLGHTVYQSSNSLKISTESSARFAKQLTPALVEPTAARAIYLLTKLGGAKVAGIIDHYPKPVKPRTISFNPKQVTKIAGAKISASEAYSALTRLRCAINKQKVTVPPERLDLLGEHDLVEEVIRLVGLDKIPATSPTTLPPATDPPAHTKWREIVRDILATSGMSEIWNYSFEDETIIKLLALSPAKDERLEISNPQSPEQSFLRTSLLPRLLGNLLTNKAELQKKFSHTERALFEIGATFRAGESVRVPGVIEEEAIVGAFVEPDASVKLVSGVVDNILKQFGITNAITKTSTGLNNIWTPDSRTLTVGDDLLGTIGRLNPSTKIAQKIKLPVALFEISLNKLIAHAEAEPNYRPIRYDKATQYQAPSIYPPIYRDLSILVAPSVTVEQAQDIIERVGGNLVVDVDLFDVYEADNRQSLAFHIAYQSMDKTLTDDEVNKLHNNIVATLKSELKADLRE